MFDNHFKYQYDTIPVATFRGRYNNISEGQSITTIYHNHREIELLLVDKGVAEFTVGDKKIHAQSGDIILVPPYILHDCYIPAQSALEHYCICFDAKILPDSALCKALVSGAMGMPPVVRYSEEIAPKLAEYLTGAFNSQTSKHDGWEMSAIGNLSLFFSLLMREKKLFKTNPADSKSDICYPIMEYIVKNYADNITSSNAAQALHVSKSYFCRVFKQKFGACFQNYLCVFRLEKAKNLLKTTSLSVSAVSQAVGFNSFSFFSKMFRKYFGVTPSQFRKNK